LGVDAAGQPLLIEKKRTAKKPIGNIINKWAQEDVKTLCNLLNK
jgi:ABC-type transporter Mla MlaB component